MWIATGGSRPISCLSYLLPRNSLSRGSLIPSRSLQGGWAFDFGRLNIEP